MIVNKNEIENWKKDIIVIKLNNTQMYDTTTHTYNHDYDYYYYDDPTTDDHTHTHTDWIKPKSGYISYGIELKT